MRKQAATWVAMMALAGMTGPTGAGEETARLPEVTVYGDLVSPRFPDPVVGTVIYDGKKAELIDLENRPEIANNNYRQALEQTPGLLLSEETSPLLSLGYRGLPPHRTQFTQVLKDGIPIHADMFGYPEAYYTPAFETVSHMEFIRGGAALMYGPQPGGALNFVTHDPRTDKPVSFETRQTFGSEQLYSTYNELNGTVDQIGYLGYFHHRQGDGFREANSDFRVDDGGLKAKWSSSESTRWEATLEYYEEEHGEPGGLTLATGPGTVNYREDREATSRFHDRFELERYAGTVALEHDISEATRLDIKAWGGYYSRYSQRQRGGGFGTLPTGPEAESNLIELQEFNTAAIEGRVRHDWTAWDQAHTLAAGTMVYLVDSPRNDKQGNTPGASEGKTIARTDRSVQYIPVFVENRFVFGDLSVTPGLRVENIWQDVEEKQNDAKTSAGTPLGDKSDDDTVALLGLGTAWKAAPRIEVYANISESYRPKVYTQTVPNGGTTLVPEDLDPTRALQFDFGCRGLAGYLTWDASVFQLNVDDQIGSVSLDGGKSTLVNVGEARHRGVELAGELAVSGMIDDLASTSLQDAVGTWSLFANALILDAEFTEGPLDGKTPQYAPDLMVRSGVRYRLGERLQISLSNTWLDDHYADDANKEERLIPKYSVWDLTGEVRIYRDTISLFGGINNLFDADYYARIRNEGIDPAAPRNYYAGIKVEFN